ncbi:Gfo/Idh/MocA family protein [Egicoccus sp. AB-alg6-2]|uniref:Gfo/Idh/MocA family protein n=1 Tax=Egicoccus sp. AB-alg6-2 TaxID=3242692 RepID=UPI00359D27BD
MIGSLHARVYADHPSTDLVGVVDADLARAENVASDLGTRAYRDLDGLLEKANLDILSVAVPEQHRTYPAVAAAAQGVHLLLEKPLAPTLEEVDELLDALEPAGVTTMVNFILRSDPRYLQVREAAQAGAFGELRTLTARRTGTAAGAEVYGPWTDLLISTAIHDLDIMTWVAGAPVSRVYAEAVAGRCAEWGHEDAVLATLRFANGVIGAVETSWVLPTSPAPLSSGLRVVGTAGGATIEGNDHGLALLDGDGLHLPDLANWPMGRSGVEGSLRASIDHFIACVRTGADPVMDLQGARAAQVVVAAIKESINAGTPVTIDTSRTGSQIP